MKKFNTYTLSMVLSVVSTVGYAAVEDLKQQALSHCTAGDVCVAVKSSCNTWQAVRKDYADEAVSYYRTHAEKANCAHFSAVSAVPLAACSRSAKRCILTGESRVLIDPRLVVPN